MGTFEERNFALKHAHPWTGAMTDAIVMNTLVYSICLLKSSLCCQSIDEAFLIY